MIRRSKSEWSVNMKKILLMIVTLSISALLLAGCGEQQPVQEEETTVENDASVQGTWKEDYFDSGYTFNADGTGMDTFWELPFTYTAYDGVITITYDDETYAVDRYSYTVDGDTLSMARISDGGAGKSFTYTRG